MKVIGIKNLSFMIHLFSNKIKILALLILLFISASCDRGYDYFAESYVNYYSEITGLSISDATYNSESRIDFISTKGGRRAGIMSSGEDLEWYRSICAQNNDLTFNKEVRLICNIPKTWAFTPDIESLSIVCKQDFDALHPAGTSLNDCVTVNYVSLYSFIQAGYKPEVRRWDYPKTCYQRRLLSELQPGDMRIIANQYKYSEGNCHLSFSTLPAETGVYEMTLQMTLAGGNTHKSTFKYDFSEMTVVK